MAYLKPEFVDRLRESVDIVTVVTKYVKLKKRGARYVGLSPFTNEKTPSFTVTPGKGLWYCFSSGKGGDAFGLVMEMEKCDYPEAVKRVAELMNMPPEYDDSPQAAKAAERHKRRKALGEVMEMAVAAYQRAYAELPEDHPAKREAAKRGLTEAAETLRLGYAPGGGYLMTELADCLEEAEELGLVRKGRDAFYNRLIYPILDRGAAGIAGRALPGIDRLTGKKVPKWINPSESALYDKSRIFYGWDAAEREVIKSGRIFLTEGYNDALALQMRGVPNAVAICGTNLTDLHVARMRGKVKHVVLALDNDRAGREATLKYVPQLLAEGFRVYVLDMPEGVKDPDEFCFGLYRETVEREGLAAMAEHGPVDGFGWLIARMIEDLPKEREIDRALAAEVLAGILATVEDLGMVEIYAQWLSDRSGISRTKLEKWVAQSRRRAEAVEAAPARERFDAWGDEDNAENDAQMYRLPKEVKEPLEEYLPVIKKYGMFQTRDSIYAIPAASWKSGPPYYFTRVANFSVRIIQHMDDEKFPMKLLKVRNTRGRERIFDTPSANLNTPAAFDKAMSDQGNYLWKGDPTHLLSLREMLYDQMGVGRKIDVLGWQPEGFWVWNNRVRMADGAAMDVDANGVVKVQNESYYIPSANSIYARNPYKYVAQKKVQVMGGDVSFEVYADLIKKVHRDHAISGILFSVASMFQDHVVERLSSFPMLFLYGPASSGKDQLALCCQSFFGVPQEAINLEGGVSTIKAQVREFAQFANTISQLSEYHRGDPKLDGVLKGLWDRRGYKRGNIDSHVGTDSIPILSSVLMTGNDYPDNAALITRLVTEEMMQTQFSAEAVNLYDDLDKMRRRGVSHITDGLISQRGRVEDEFHLKYQMLRAGLSDRLPEAEARMVQNMAALGSFYHVLKDHLIFPFTHAEMVEHFVTVGKQQIRKLRSNSAVERWWDCFLAAMRGHRGDRLQHGRDFQISDGYVYFNFTTAYNRIQPQWFLQHREPAPGKMKMKDELKDSAAFHQSLGSHRMGGQNTSVEQFILHELPVKDEIVAYAEWQDTELRTPRAAENETENGDKDLPF